MESVREVPRNVNHLTGGREMGPHTGAGIRDEWELIRDVTVAEDTSSVTLSGCLLYTSPSPRDLSTSRMPSSA